jgi:hypothetical protein
MKAIAAEKAILEKKRAAQAKLDSELKKKQAEMRVLNE